MARDRLLSEEKSIAIECAQRALEEAAQVLAAVRMLERHAALPAAGLVEAARSSAGRITEAIGHLRRVSPGFMGGES